MSTDRFITLEGVEGAGKSTAARALQSALQQRGFEVLLTREPGGTPVAEALREILLRHGSEHINSAAETLLMFAARAVHLDNAIRPALAAGKWVICDRFTDATYAYQGAGRGVDTSLIDRLAAAVHAQLWPTRTLLLDLPVGTGLERAKARATADRFEAQQQEFFERVRGAYLARAAADPARFRVIDARASEAEVGASALQAIADLLPAGNPPA